MNQYEQDQPLHILLADDDTDDRSFFETALKEIPIATRLTTVRDGEQLMAYLFENADHLPAILFLDLSMPRKTGFECLIEIKEHIKFRHLPVVVFTTSFGRDGNLEQSLMNTLSNIGAQEYVRKPSDLVQLQHLIHTALIRAAENSPVSVPVVDFNTPVFNLPGDDRTLPAYCR